jgi:hypothetical protein
VILYEKKNKSNINKRETRYP